MREFKKAMVLSVFMVIFGIAVSYSQTCVRTKVECTMTCGQYYQNALGGATVNCATGGVIQINTPDNLNFRSTMMVGMGTDYCLRYREVCQEHVATSSDPDEQRRADSLNARIDSLRRASNENAKTFGQIMDAIGTKMWDSKRYHNDTASSAMGQLCLIGLVMAFALVLVQIFLDFVTMVLGQGQHPMKILQKNIGKVFIVAILLTPGTYDLIVVNTIAGTADAIANTINDDGFQEKWKQGLEKGLEGMYSEGGKKWSVMALGASLFTYVISGLVFLISLVINMIFSLLQSLIFMLAYFLGPLCIPFMLFDGTAGIARSWFSFLLTVCFFSVIGALALFVGTAANFQVNAATGATEGNALVMIIYSALSIVLLLMAYPISSAIFGGGGGGGGVGGIMSGGALATGAAVALTGGAALAAKVGGAAVSLGGGAAGAVGMKGVGGAMSSAGSAMSNYGQNAQKMFSQELNKAIGRSSGSDLKQLVPESLRNTDVGLPHTLGGHGLLHPAGEHSQSKLSKQEQARIDAQKSVMQTSNEQKTADIRNNPHNYHDLGASLSGYGYDFSDVANASVDASGNVNSVTTNTGDMFRATPGGWEAVTPEARTELQGSAGAAPPLDAHGKTEWAQRSAQMASEIRDGGTQISNTVEKGLSGTGYSAADVASVRMDRASGQMNGVTMRTGEQLSFDSDRGKFKKA